MRLQDSKKLNYNPQLTMILNILIVSLIKICISQKTECSTFVEDLINDILDFKIYSIPIPSLMYSGITPNNPGQMTQCLLSNYSYYLVFTRNSTTKIETFTGLCIPNQCTSDDIYIALQLFHCRVYDVNEFKSVNIVATVGSIVVVVWLSILVFWSLFVYFRQPVINEFVVGQKNQKLENAQKSQQNSAQPSAQTFSEPKQQDDLNILNFYQGYRKLFRISLNSNVFSLILFLAVISFTVSIQFSFRQNIAQNTTQIYEILDSYWGVLVCNIQIALQTILFIQGFRLAYGISEKKKIRTIGRFFFDAIFRKWFTLILMSLLVYSFSSFSIKQPLSQIWNSKNAKDCPNYIWQIWFLFRNLQLDCQICLPWFALIEAELLLTILSCPLIIIFRINKKFGYLLIAILIATSIFISHQILTNEAIVFAPAKIMNSQKEYWIDYQGNTFVRMNAFYLGVFFGVFSSEGLQKGRTNKPLESRAIRKIEQNPIIQWAITLIGLSMMIFCFIQIRFYLQVNMNDSKPYIWMITNPLFFVVGLGFFVLPCYVQGSTKITKLIKFTVGWSGWIHLDRISLTFYMIAPMVIGYTTYSAQNSIYYYISTVFISLIGDLSVAYFLSILITASLQNQLGPIVSWMQIKILGKQRQYSDIIVVEV